MPSLILVDTVREPFSGRGEYWAMVLPQANEIPKLSSRHKTEKNSFHEHD